MKEKLYYYGNDKEKQSIIGMNIKKLRTDHQMNQTAFGDKLHLLRQTISAYERGVTLPDIFVLIQIADLFDITLDELAGRKKAPSSLEKDKRKKEKS